MSEEQKEIIKAELWARVYANTLIRGVRTEAIKTANQAVADLEEALRTSI
jgi:phage tail protein X